MKTPTGPEENSARTKRDTGMETTSDIGTLADLVGWHARRTPDATCVMSATGEALSWRALDEQIAYTRTTLRAFGITRDDRVAMAMPSGPLTAAAFLSIAAGAACAPLNPACGFEELCFYLEDLGARALIVAEEVDEAAVAAARRLGVPVLRPRPAAEAFCRFILQSDVTPAVVPSGDRAGRPEDLALLLHTSGTTARPKLVPLRHSNLLASAHNMVRSLMLGVDDRCLNLMPLFHIHGLVGGLLAPLAGGGSSICAPAFRADRFCNWLEVAQPTWLTAVPTMHRAIVSAARASRPRCGKLRFIRSSSAPLPAMLYDDLAQTFGVPVVEAYSMTEAAHQMTCNPLDAGRQKRGTVGLPAGSKIALLDEAGHLLPAGEVGEVVIRGPSVFTGYEDNPEANADSFVNGWFRTGDQGRFDEDGYLVLTGRLKEQINRGGEKISPLEIDHVLLGHPGVAEAIAFGFPHTTLGEEVAAAVVLKPGSDVGGDDLDRFLAERIAPFKRPKRIVILEQIPKGPTGKHQRRLMSKLLGFDDRAPTAGGAVQPSSPLEHELLVAWRKTLNRPEMGVEDDFFEAGGDSLTALELLIEIEAIVGRKLPESMLLDHRTVRSLALSATALENKPRLIEVQAKGDRVPFFYFHGDYEGGYYTRGLSDLLGADQPFYSIAPHATADAPPSIEAMAADRLPLLLAANPGRPFRLAGYCNGGMVALECAKLLRAAGRQVEFVGMIDSPPLNFRPFMRAILRAADRLGDACAQRSASHPGGDEHPIVARVADVVWRQISNLQQRSVSVYVRDLFLGLVRRVHARFGGGGRNGQPPMHLPIGRLRDQIAKRELAQSKVYNRLFRRYVPDPGELPLVYYSATYRRAAVRHLGANAGYVALPGGHWGCITTHAAVLADDLRQRFDALDAVAIARVLAAGEKARAPAASRSQMAVRVS